MAAIPKSKLHLFRSKSCFTKYIRQITGQITDVTEPQASNDDAKVEEERLSSMSKDDLVSELKTSSGKIKQQQILNRFV